MKNKVFSKLQKKRTIIKIIILISIIVYVLQVFYINHSHTYASKICSYQIGEDIELRDDFFFYESEKANGYRIKVLETEIIKKDEFYDKYNVEDRELFEFSEYVLLIKANFKNISSPDDGSTGVDLSNYMIQKEAFMEYINCNAVRYVNEIEHPKFYLKQGTDLDFILPFGIDTYYITLGELKNKNTSLVISLYPHKKVIYLNKDNN